MSGMRMLILILSLCSLIFQICNACEPEAGEALKLDHVTYFAREFDEFGDVKEGSVPKAIFEFSDCETKTIFEKESVWIQAMPFEYMGNQKWRPVGDENDRDKVHKDLEAFQKAFDMKQLLFVDQGPNQGQGQGQGQEHGQGQGLSAHEFDANYYDYDFQFDFNENENKYNEYYYDYYDDRNVRSAGADDYRDALSKMKLQMQELNQYYHAYSYFERAKARLDKTKRLIKNENSQWDRRTLQKMIRPGNAQQNSAKFGNGYPKNSPMYINRDLYGHGNDGNGYGAMYQ